MNLSASEVLAIKGGASVPVILDDVECVVVRKDVYQQVQQLLDGDDGAWTANQLRAMLAKSAEANGWNEPEMDAYDHYDDELTRRCP